MSQDFTDRELESLREDQEAHMLDTCKIQARIETLDTFGQKVESWPTDGEETPCGLEMSPGTERHTAEGNVIQYDATIRLPLYTVINSVDRVKITKRFGVRQEIPLIYEVLSPLQMGASGLRYALRRLEV